MSGANALDITVLPLARPVSGRYEWKVSGIPVEAVYEQLRLDVDGTYPQMVASGTIVGQSLAVRGIHWIARLTALGNKRWAGPIEFKDNLGGPPSFPLPHTDVHIAVTGSGAVL